MTETDPIFETLFERKKAQDVVVYQSFTNNYTNQKVPSSNWTASTNTENKIKIAIPIRSSSLAKQLFLSLLTFLESIFFFFYRASSSAVRPTPNLEDRVSVFTFPGNRVAKLQPQVSGSLCVAFFVMQLF
jgi:hypothetical protein